MMKQIRKRLLSFLLTGMMLLSLLPTAALAATATQPTAGNGTAENPYEISSAANLLWFAQQVNGGQTGIHAKLTADISLSGQSWTPIGNSARQYAGTFDGNGKTITGLTYTDAGNTNSTSYVGLFGAVTGGTVKNLTISSASVTTSSGKYGAGIVVGNLTRGTVSGVTVTNSTITRSSGDTTGICLGGVVGFNGGTIINCSTNNQTRVTDNGSGNFVGGIAGRNGTKDVDSEVGLIEGCSNGAYVSTASGFTCIGGIVGKNTNTTTQDSKVLNCINSGTVWGATSWGGSRVGGIVGDNDGLTADCVNSGGINSKNVSVETSGDTEFSAGGVVGSNDGKVERCGNTGNIYGVRHYGGVVGYFNNSAGYIKDCWDVGVLHQDVNYNNPAQPGNSYAGGIVGRLLDGKVSNCWSSTAYWPYDSEQSRVGLYAQYAVVGGQEISERYTGTVTNCYYSCPPDKSVKSQTTDDGIEGTTYVVKSVVSSGKLALLLNAERTDEASVWRQTLGTDTHPYPVSTSESIDHAIVWSTCGGLGYSNDQPADSAAGHTFDENGFCTVCGGYQPATPVTESNYTELGLTADCVGYYAIANAGQLYWFSDATTYHIRTSEEIGVAANAVLVADITVNVDVLDSVGADGRPAGGATLRLWYPIAASSDENCWYSGTFDGKGHTIGGLYGRMEVDSESDPNYYTGVVGVLADGGCVRNLTVADSFFYGFAAGGIVGVAIRSETGTTVENCAFDGTAMAEICAGGIVGGVDFLSDEGTVTISNCTSDGAVAAGYYAGGATGFAVGNVTVSDCRSGMDITMGIGGGLIGYALGNETLRPVIDGCVFDGKITTNAYTAGGLIGFLDGTADIKDSVSMGLVTNSEESDRYYGGVWGYFSANSGTIICENVLYLRQPGSAENAGYENASSTYTPCLPDGVAMFDLTAPVYDTPINAQAAEISTAFDSSRFSLSGALLPTLSDNALVFGTVGTETLTVALANGLSSGISVTVSPKDLSASAIVTGVRNTYATAEDAAAAVPGIHVFDGDILLTEGTDYTVSNENSQFTITFRGNYQGTKMITYTIDEALVATAADYNGAYDGTAHGITVNAPAGTTLTYSAEEAGTYTETAITQTNVGTKVVYWKAQQGEKTVSGAALITITPAALTIRADNKTIYVGDTLPEYTYTVIGLRGSDSLTTVPTVTCPTADNRKTGTYTITASGAAAGDNYTISYVDGALTVRLRSSGGGSGSSGTHTVSVDSTKNGTVTANPSGASEGTTVTITVKPDEGYKLDSLTVTDAAGNTVAVSGQGNTYTFVMPASAVSVSASFVKEAELPFVDVGENHTFRSYIEYVYENGIMQGNGEHFDPAKPLTRAQLVVTLYRMAGSPGADGTELSFSDTDKLNTEFASAVKWAVANGIVGGYEDGSFRPGAPVTRQAMMAILYRYANSSKFDTDVSSEDNLSRFPDGAQVSSGMTAAVNWAVENGFVGGNSARLLNPAGSTTRGAAAKILAIFHQTYLG